MDLHIYTRELLEKHLLPELKEIAQDLGVIPEGNKTRRETWIAALVGKPFPVFQSIENSPGVDRAQESAENSPGVDRAEDIMESWTAWEKEHCAWLLDAAWCVYRGENKQIRRFLPTSKTLRLEGMKEGCEYLHIWQVSECTFDESGNPLPVSSSLYAQEPIENSPGVGRVQEPIENSPGVGRVQEPIEEYLDIKGLWELDLADCPACGGIHSLNAKWSQEYAYGYWIIYCTNCDSTCTCGIEDLPHCLRGDPEDGEEAVESIGEEVVESIGEEAVESIGEFPDLESALAEIARLPAQNDELLKLARSQFETIRRANTNLI